MFLIWMLQVVVKIVVTLVIWLTHAVITSVVTLGIWLMQVVVKTIFTPIYSPLCWTNIYAHISG
jgi:hypothetical protein